MPHSERFEARATKTESWGINPLIRPAPRSIFSRKQNFSLFAFRRPLPFQGDESAVVSGYPPSGSAFMPLPSSHISEIRYNNNGLDCWDPP
ncbi:hypothetical protein Ddc_07935 [Ditylenchus destructor]|nr:hypothetical protein Ddc_07935 [Ditylenchus destructor]